MAHTAHGNPKSKTICRINMRAGSFDPLGPSGSNEPAHIFTRQIVFDLGLPCAVWATSPPCPA